MSEQRLWHQLWTWLDGQHYRLFLLSFVILCNVVVSVAAPVVLKFSLDLVPGGPAVLVAALFGLLLVSKFLVDLAQSYLVAVINSEFIHRLRTDVFRKVLANQMSFFDRSISGKLVSRVVNDSNELISSAEQMSNAFSQFFVLIGIVVTMVVFDPGLTLAATAVAPLLFVAVVAMRKFQRRVSKRWREKIAAVNANFGEVIGSISVSKSFGREEENLVRFHQINEETYQASKIRGLAIFAVGPIQDFLKNAGIVILLVVATSLDVSVTLLYLFILLQSYFFNPITQIARSYNQFQTSFAAVERLLEIMADSSTVEQSSGGLDGEIKGKVEFRGLNFSYDGENPVLTGIDLTVEEGSTTALVGHTGAGKSTIVSLIMGFYTHGSGELLIDGHRISEYDLRALRRQIAYVSQDIFLFSGTLLDNLRMGRPDATEEEVMEALDAVQATEFLRSLPKGLHTHVQEEGSNLSRGQRQMISLARALISDPRILILDEFTSSLDLYTEAKIQEGIRTLVSGRTSIVIAHRLTTILHSDQIVVMEGGRITESGTHPELMERGGRYSELFSTYFSFQVSDLRIKA